MDFEFNGQTALVTGASQGIGRAIARGLSMQGVAIFLASPLASYITGTVIPVDGGMYRFAF